MWGEGRLLAAMRQEGVGDCQKGLLKELLEHGQEEQAAGCHKEGMTWDQVIRLDQMELVEGGGQARKGFWLPGKRQDLRPGSKTG